MGLTNKLGLLAQSVQQDTSLNIGIGGAANASFKLQVTGATNLTGALSGTSATFTNKIEAISSISGDVIGDFRNTSATGYGFAIQGGNDSGRYSFKVVNYNASATYLYVRGDGNVGIGTSSPTAKLEIQNAPASDWGISVFGNTTTGQSFGGIIRGGTNSSDVAFRVNNAANNATYFTVQGNGNVGIGTSSPTNGKLEIQTGSTAAGLWVQTGGTTGSFTIADFRTGSNLSAFSIKGNGYSTFSAYVEINSSETGLRLNVPAGLNALSVGGTGNISVDYPGVGGGRFQLDGNGNVYNRTGVYGTISSDLRLKENIVDASSKLDDVLKLRVVNFNLKSDLDKKKNIGFIAQEMQEVFPSLVYEKDTREYDEDGNFISGFEDSLGVKVGMEFAILVKAIQEQQAQIEELKAIVATK
jgi:hypothetical protein